MRKVMIIGAVGAGKSSLVKALFGDSRPESAAKTQSLVYREWLIDTPGEYSENPLYYRSLMATSHEAAAVLLVQDATRSRNYFPPGFASGFPVPAVGAVTKIDHPDADAQRASALLGQSLPGGDIYPTSSATGEGVEELKERLWKLIGQ
ncbi:ethanolamine utilization protein EutP [Paenibacillus darwinianus]|uniref:Ethanolamine utilization protein EutP n=1 Tax=Paenibacillus darwinianus TaxID=1380763 RepID=A0A9W5W7I8_9BACL|nr:EutP/PduV family microcompartment system protein [Paenibacillus darwinianus]EXX87788.1 ethanolamine utilization protein EutP [Paenibacillus darwinianus]EXX88162.1 ethanolamine utilization protein EutP [Paenibacillus darwinianus]EXX89041.1 ethanolamine utilization protein EutP [Paenibacillus darwinianus]